MRDDFSDEARETFAQAEFEHKPVNASLSVGSRLPLSHQEKAIAELHETINQLAQRLKPVLTPVNEAGGREPSESVEAKDITSPLAEQMNANNRGIRRASDNIKGLMERLEC